MNRQVVSVIAMDGALEACEQLRTEVFLRFIQSLDHLVDLVEVEELLGHVICHPEVLTLQDHHLLIELFLLKALQELEDVLALAFEDVAFLQGVDDLVFVGEKLLKGGVIDLDQYITDINLDEDSLPAPTSGGDQLIGDGERLLREGWRFNEGEIVLLFYLHVFLTEPLLRDCDLLDHFKDQPAEMNVLWQIRLKGLS